MGLRMWSKSWVELPVWHVRGSLPAWQHHLVGSLLLAGLL